MPLSGLKTLNTLSDFSLTVPPPRISSRILNCIKKYKGLPRYDYYEIYNVPPVSQVSSLMQDEAISYNLQKTLYGKDISEYRQGCVYDLILSSQ